MAATNTLAHNPLLSRVGAQEPMKTSWMVAAAKIASSSRPRTIVVAGRMVGVDATAGR